MKRSNVRIAAESPAGAARLDSVRRSKGTAASRPNVSTSRLLRELIFIAASTLLFKFEKIRRLVRRRQRRSAAVTLEPAHHVQLRAHPIRGLGAGAVIFLIKAQQCRWNPAIFERLVEFLALRNGRAAVKLPGHDERWGLHIAHMHQ